MSNETVTATSQPAEAAVPTIAPEAKGDAPKAKGNLSVAQAAQRLLNIEAEAAKPKSAPAEQTAAPAEKPADAQSQPATEAAQAESAEPAVEAAPEANAEGAVEAEGDVPSHDITPEQKREIQKRINKEVARRKALETQLNELTLKLTAQEAQAKTTPPPIVPLPKDAPPLAHIEDANGLLALQQQAKEAKRFAEEQLDRDDFTGVQVGDKQLGRSELKAIIRNANRTLEDDIPQRFQFLQQREQAQKMAYEKFPFLKDRSAPEYVAAQQARIQMPWINNLPNADWIIGVQIKGLKAMELESKALADLAKKPKTGVVASSKVPSAQTVVSSAGGTEARTASPSKSQNQLEALRSQMSKAGGVTANQAAAFLLQRELAKQNR